MLTAGHRVTCVGMPEGGPFCTVSTAQPGVGFRKTENFEIMVDINLKSIFDAEFGFGVV